MSRLNPAYNSLLMFPVENFLNSSAAAAAADSDAAAAAAAAADDSFFLISRLGTGLNSNAAVVRLYMSSSNNELPEGAGAAG